MDLIRRLHHVLSVATTVLDRFGEHGYTHPEDPARSVPAEKVVAETGLLALAASTVEDSVVGTLVEGLVARLGPVARGDRALIGMALKPSAAWDYAQAHVFLTRLGSPSPGFDVMLIAADASPVAGGQERPPHRALEMDWLRRAVAQAGGDRLPDLVCGRGCALATPIDVFGGTREGLYAFSHALMYIGDFGIQPSRWPRGAAEICADADAAVAVCLDDQDYDLVGELLLTWPLTGVAWSPTAAFAFRVLAEVEDAASFLPSHSIDLERLRSMTGSRHTDYLLGSTYHTIYVMGLLCASALLPDQAPPAKMPDRHAVPGAAEQIMPFLHSGGMTQHWTTTYATLEPVEQDAVAPFLFTVAAHRSVKARQFAALQELLTTCHRVGLADTPSASQGAELLDRLATFSAVRDHAVSAKAGALHRLLA